MEALVKRVLLTGFEPFHNSKLNPSTEIIKAIEHPCLIGKKVLPVTFSESSTILLGLVDELNPDVVISLGQAEGRSQITPERIAINLDDARIADNAGFSPKESPIITGGPAAYFSTLPVRQIVDKLTEINIPASISLSAGTFVCNHIFYKLQNYCRDKEILSGFIHVPLIEEQSEEFPGLPTMKLSEMVRAIKVVLDTVCA